MAGDKTSPWVYVLVGCVAVLIVGALVVVVIGYAGYRWVQNVERTMKDPAAREDKVREILGSDELPEGYHPMVGLSIPLLMELAVLSDRETAPGEEPEGFDERGFIFIKMISFGRQAEELRDFFEGKTDDASVLRRNNINIRADEIIKRGVFETEDARLMYLVQRGRLDAFGGRHEGLTSMMLVECPDDRRTRMAIWFAPESDESGGDTIIAEGGSPADENAMRDFLGHFDLCPG